MFTGNIAAKLNDEDVNILEVGPCFGLTSHREQYHIY